MDANGVVHVPTPVVLLSALPLFCIDFLGRRFELGLENNLLVGIGRSFVQLMILGWILHPIFEMGMGWPWLVFLYVLFMITIATRESMSRPKYTFEHHALATFLALLLSISVVGSFAFMFVIRPMPRWNPQYVIPICGMLMGNCINGVSLTVNTLCTQIMEGGRREVELNLSFGATGWASAGRLVKAAVKAGVTPMINSLNVIGLVSIPGMMTGQILGGSPVTEAAHYQILIMYLIATCTFATIFMNVFIIYRVAFDAGTHVLRTDRFIEIVKKKRTQGGTTSHNSANSMQVCFDRGMECARAILCCCGLCSRGDKDNCDAMSLPDVEKQPLSNYGATVQSDRIQILTRQLDRERSRTVPFFRIVQLKFSTPLSHTKRNNDASSRPPSLAPSPVSSPSTRRPAVGSGPDPQQRRVLCTNLNASLNSGEIGIVRGPSGSGKSSLLRVLAGLAPMDRGDVVLSGLRLAECCGLVGRRSFIGLDDNLGSMIQWRTAVRYVTQYKVDVPGTPREFLRRIAEFCSKHSHGDGSFCVPPEDVMVSQTASYLERWGMGDAGDGQQPYLDREWKVLSGGESQRSEFCTIESTGTPAKQTNDRNSHRYVSLQKLFSPSPWLLVRGW
ncbi:hypothetical protein ACHAWF_014154 [Thalassiosira exigua]